MERSAVYVNHILYIQCTQSCRCVIKGTKVYYGDQVEYRAGVYTCTCMCVKERTGLALA